jgi:SET and MYND domain-containing protein
LLKPSKNLDALHQAQREIHGLLRSAMRAAKHPGIYPSYEDLPTIETNLRTIINNVFPSAPWPEHLEPLPSARLVLANLYLDQSKPIPALRNALKGKFLSIRGRAGTGTGPEWINEMTDVTTVLVVAGSLPREAAVEDKTFPSVDDIRTVTYGYLYATCREAGRVFGGLAAYTRGLCGMLTDMLRTNPGVRIGTREFRGLFEAAQRTVLAWAGVDGVDGVVLS